MYAIQELLLLLVLMEIKAMLDERHLISRLLLLIIAISGVENINED